MRVITGNARGKKLVALEGLDVRPTSNMVKESIFSIVAFDVPYGSVLDLFAGSGQLGIEALSREADFAVFVDKNKNSIEVIKENLNLTKLISKSRVLHMDSVEYLKVCKKKFDVVLVDPPYSQGLVLECLPLISQVMNPNGAVVCEHERGLELPEKVGKLTKIKNYRYGKIFLTLYRMEGVEE